MSIQFKNILLPNAFKDLANVLGNKELLRKFDKEHFQDTDSTLRVNVLSELKIIKKKTNLIISNHLKSNPYLAPSSLSAYTYATDRIIRSIVKLVLEKMFVTILIKKKRCQF